MSDAPHNFKECGSLFIPKTEDELYRDKAAEEAKSESLQERYHTDIHVHVLADEIHHSRMMSGPACDQCIQIAIRRLEKKASSANCN